MLRTRLVFSLAVVAILVPRTAWATWSVIAVDLATKRVVIASATCVARDDEFLKGVQAVIVPGKGVAACQAAVDQREGHPNQMLVFQELQKGTPPEKIIELLSADPAFQGRQFGILDLQGRSAGHSGLTNGYVSQDIQGRVPGTDIYYSIQGNILRAGEVVPKAIKAFLDNKGALTDRVMAAMDAADAAGGDSRCTCPETPAASSIPCEGKTAHVAYILMAEATDTNGDSHNNGKYAMYINVAQPGENNGPGAIRNGENLNPVKTLRLRYDAWRKTQAGTYRQVQGFKGSRVRVHGSPFGGSMTMTNSGGLWCAIAVVTATVATLAQNPPTGQQGTQQTQPPPQGQRGGAPGGGQRGGGRGRAQIMTLSTTAWADGGTIPLKFTQAGAEVSPALAWSNVPANVTSFVLIAHDLDASGSNGFDDVPHWLVWNIPGTATSLPEAVPQGPELPDGMRQISVSGPYYRGPGAPANGPAHHYAFELFALDATIDVAPAAASPADTRAAVVAAMAGHVRGKGVVTGLFKRP